MNNYLSSKTKCHWTNTQTVIQPCDLANPLRALRVLRNVATCAFDVIEEFLEPSLAYELQGQKYESPATIAYKSHTKITTDKILLSVERYELLLDISATRDEFAKHLELESWEYAERNLNRWLKKHPTLASRIKKIKHKLSRLTR